MNANNLKHFIIALTVLNHSCDLWLELDMDGLNLWKKQCFISDIIGASDYLFAAFKCC